MGKEWLILDGSLVLAGILEEARAAWVAMAATNAKESHFLAIYSSTRFISYSHFTIP